MAALLHGIAASARRGRLGPPCGQDARVAHPLESALGQLSSVDPAPYQPKALWAALLEIRPAFRDLGQQD
eukprot:10917040-Lingulodinium_polyedra.AAC.1